MALTAGLGGAARHGCVALVEQQTVLGVCEQERVTRRRGAGFNASGLPDEALDVLLKQASRSRRDIAGYVVAEPTSAAALQGQTIEQLDHHFAHACASYLSSPFHSATVVVCDAEDPRVSVWRGEGPNVARVEWPWRGPGFVDLYSDCAELLNLPPAAAGQRFEAFARLCPGHRDDRLDHLIDSDGHSLELQRDWRSAAQAVLSAWGSPSDVPSRARLAAALQARIGELLLALLARVRRQTGGNALCVGGTFFYHSSINTLVKNESGFASVFVPVDPGNAGLAVGTALIADRAEPRCLSPFLGPAYEPDEIKATLDNCKLRYDWVREDDSIGLAVEALVRGKLVGWFDGAMEWGPRALGARSILANPFLPYVLENLNRFLKQREPWRGYALSTLQDRAAEYLNGPSDAPFMECDYRARDPELFRHIQPSKEAALRVQMVNGQAPPRFRKLLSAFASRTGLPVLVNTSFNGFHEPIVCSPRDAVRVFYGSGLDALVLGQFVITKE
jgi:carbamoyltransferase